MKKLGGFLNDYIVEFNWKDLGLFKMCMCAFGIMAGLSIPKDKKRPALIISAIVFAITCIALFASLFGVECPFCSGDDDFDEYDDFEDFDEYDEEDGQGFVMKISAEQ